VTVAPEAAQDAGEILENALAALVGRTATWIVEGAPPTFEEALAEYSNAELADTAGLEGGPVGSDARRERRTFMRSLQRYRNYLAGTGKESRRPSEASRIRLADLGRRRREREATPDGAGAVARLIRRHGLTVTTLRGVIKISNDESYREVHNVFCRPSRLDAAGFGALGADYTAMIEALFYVWATAYGIPSAELRVLEVLTLEIGRQAGEMGGRRVRRAA